MPDRKKEERTPRELEHENAELKEELRVLEDHYEELLDENARLRATVLQMEDQY